MKKFIYIAAGTVFVGSIMSSVYAIDAGYEDRARATPTNQIGGTPPKSLNDALAEDAYKKFAHDLALKNVKKEKLIVEIGRDKERADSLVEEVLEKVGSAKLSEIAPGGFSITFSTGVKTNVTVGEDGAFHASHVSPPVSPMKTLRKGTDVTESEDSRIVAAATLIRSESGNHLVSAN
jgi:hypothetical protein